MFFTFYYNTLPFVGLTDEYNLLLPPLDFYLGSRYQVKRQIWEERKYSKKSHWCCWDQAVVSDTLQ